MTRPELIIMELPGDSSLDEYLGSRFSASECVVGIPDNSGAAPGMDALVRAGIWKQKGFKVSMRLNCRDRNRIDIASRFYGAHELNVEYILIETGYHIQQGPFPESRSVYDIDPIQTVHFLRQLPKPSKSKHMASVKIGLRTPIQEIDNFELNRISRILYPEPDFLVVYSKRRFETCSNWIRHCSKVNGFQKLKLLWEINSEAMESGQDVHVPDGVHGLHVTY